MAKEPSTAVARRFSAPTPEELDKLEEILLAENPLDYEVVTDPAEVTRQMRKQLMYAESDDELESFGDAEGWSEYVGVPFEIHGFKVNPSTVEGQNGFYFVVFVTDMRDGSSRVLTTGSDGVMAAIFNLARRNQIPGAIRKLEVAEKATRRGYYPQKLVRANGEES